MVEEAARAPTSDELVGQLAHELSLLVRSDVELAVAERSPQLRRIATELAAALAAGVALLLALGAASWAAVQGLTLTMPSWAASLIVAAAWAAGAGALLLVDHPWQLRLRLKRETGERAIESARQRRSDAEEAVKRTAEQLGKTVAREAVEREVGAGMSAAEHMAGDVEHEVEDRLKELLVLLLEPGRAGLSLLERIIGRPSAQE